MLNEPDTRANLIDPKLHEAGWSNNLISREYPISAGRIEIIGETFRRAAPNPTIETVKIADTLGVTIDELMK